MKVIDLFLFVFYLIIFSSCSKGQEEIPDNLSGWLLFIEDLDGEGGLGNWNFGDVVLFNPEIKEKYILTNDRYFDIEPTYSKKYNIIIFNSLRDNQTYTGIGKGKKLFQYNIKNKKIEEFRTKYKFHKIEDFIDGPKFNENGDKIIIYKHPDTLLIYDFTKDTLKIAIDDYSTIAKSYAWKDDENILLNPSFYNKEKKNNESIIGMLNLVTGERERLIESNGYFHEVFDYMDNKIVIKKNELDDPFTGYIIIYDIENEKEILKIDPRDYGFYWITEAVFSKDGNGLYLNAEKEIAIKTGEDMEGDIYYYEIKTGEITNITNDGHLRKYMSIIR